MEDDKYLMFKSFSVPYYYSILFGWMPIRIPKNDNDKRNKSIWCIPGILFLLCYVVLLVISGNITHMLRNEIKYQGNRTSSNLTIHDRIQIIVAPMFLISLWLNQTFIMISYVLMPFNLKGLRNVFELFNTFFKSHRSIMGDMVTTNKIARNTNVECVSLIALNTVFSIVSAVISFKRIRLSFGWKLFVMVDNVIEKLEALPLCIQFWCMCSILAKCFKCLNAALQDTLRARKNHVLVTKPPDLFIVPDRSTLPAANTETHLRRFNQAHKDLCSILVQINGVYQVLILLSVITCILCMLPHLFVLGIIMAYSNFRVTPQLSMVIWPLQYTIRVYIMCKAASIASTEAQRTKSVLKAAFHRHLTTTEKHRIKLFLGRIDSEKTRFSLYGLTYLDNAFFLSSIMAVGGYLVIIIQSYMTVIEEQYPIHARPTADKFDE